MPRIVAGVVGVYLLVDMTTFGLIYFTVTLALPLAVDFHLAGVRRVRAYEARERERASS